MIVVFGSINLDLTVGVERLPRPGETISGMSFAAVPGGKGANQALAARRAGSSVALAGAVGNDAFAPTALEELIDAGVDLAWLRRVSTPTGIAMIHVEAGGQNSITVVPGANADALSASVPDAVLGPENTLLMQLEVPLGAVADLAHRARSRGARVVLNAAPAFPLPLGLVESLDVLIVNEHEAAALAAAFGMEASPRAFATAMHRAHRCATIVTLGAEGTLAAVDGNIVRVPAPQVAVVDTTGAGDAFAGALAAALDRGVALARALAEGVAAGSLACGIAGAQAAAPDAATIKRVADTVESRVSAQPID